MGCATVFATGFGRSARACGAYACLVLLLGAIFLAVFVVPGWWGIGAVLVAAVYEGAEKVFWIRYSRRRPVAVGAEAMIGASARVVSDCAPRGLVRFRGELWRACCAEPARTGELVRIGGVGRDLTLDVAPERARSSARRHASA